MKTDIAKLTATERQIEVLKFIIRFKEEQGYSPTLYNMTDRGW